MPSLMRVAGAKAPDLTAAMEMKNAVDAALGAAKAAGYRVEVLTGKVPDVEKPDARKPRAKPAELRSQNSAEPESSETAAEDAVDDAESADEETSRAKI